jgi:hypothetical protein
MRIILQWPDGTKKSYKSSKEPVRGQMIILKAMHPMDADYCMLDFVEGALPERNKA